jgi:NADH-quinone oxidoreductase subunit N
MIAATNMLPALPEIVLAVLGMGLMMVGVFTPDKRALPVVNALTGFSLLIALIIVVAQAKGRVLAFGGLFVTDDFAVFMKVLVLAGSILVLLMSQDFVKREGMARFEFPILIVYATVGMMMMISANDLIALYIGLELQSLSLYVIAAFQRDNVRSSEAGLKYFVLGALSSGMLLYGCSLIYGFSGSTQFEVLSGLFAKPEMEVSAGLVVGIVFLAAGLAFKVSAVPFHMWTPDVYEGAPTPVTAFFAVAPKIAAIAVGSMVLGAFAAIAQRNVKRLMAYSSIGHVGYALIGLAAGSEAGLHGILVYMAIYLAMTVGTFACILCMRRNGRMVENIGDLSGLAKTHPGVALALLVFMFSLAGIPPMAGFFGKLYIFLAAIDAELYTLAVIGVVSSVVGAFYYLRIIKIVYFDENEAPLDKQTDRPLRLVITVAGLAILLFFIWPGPVVETAAQAAAALFQG